jgi:putative tricarboxylic transport membrane protein
MLTRDRVAGAVIVLLSLYVLWEDRVLPLGTYHKPGPGYMPMILAVILGIAGVLIVLTAGGSPPFASVQWTEWRHALAILAGCAFTAVALERLGYRVTVILLVGFLLSVVERRRPLTVIAMALVLSLGTFYVFYTLLRVPLPLGPGGF